MAHRATYAGRLLVVVAGLLVAALLAGCTGVAPRAPATARVTGRLVVLATPALTEIMTALTARFETANPGLEVVLTFGPDAQLAKQATATGADLILVDGEQALGAVSLAQPPTPIATNFLVVAIAPDNPHHLASLAELTRTGLRVVLCAPVQPCGTAADAMLAQAAVRLPKAVRVSDVRAARDLVGQGKADAALVYRTDTRLAQDRVGTLEVGQSRDQVIVHLGALPAGSVNPTAARALLTFLTSDAARQSLRAVGFQLPDPTATTQTSPP